jgi:hypothetical protein
MNYKLLILGIILGIVLSGLIYWFLTYVNKKSDPNDTSTTVGATKNYLLEGSLTIPLKRFKFNSKANRFCIELWLFINPNAIVGTNSLNIFIIGTLASPIMSLDLKNTTELIVTINYPKNTYTYTITPSFFLQKWEQVIISIDQYLIDLYLDGKLMSSTMSKDTTDPIPIPKDSDTIVFNSIDNRSDLYVSGLNIKNVAMDPKTALKNYNNGKSKVNGSTNVSLALTKNENIAKNFMLF